MDTENFKWLPGKQAAIRVEYLTTVLECLEYDVLLDKIATTDIVDSEWNVLRDVIKYKINENITLFLAEKPSPSPLPTLQPQTSPSGGLKLPPFPPRKQPGPVGHGIPLSYMTEEQANELKGHIFAQLEEFDSNPPFTIQRVCELCLDPRRHYSSVGKYLRAVEKSLLVTSSWDSYPPLSEMDSDPNGRSVFALGSTRQSAPSTPLFSPIPFLHEDARRSKSRSPPPSPLVLTGSVVSEQGEPLESKALGLVDELDDPNPGHMSDHPTALTSVTTTGNEPTSRPFLGSLEQRFVREEESAAPGVDTTNLDEDKENNKSQ